MVRLRGGIFRSCVSSLRRGASWWEGVVLLATWSSSYFWMTRGNVPVFLGLMSRMDQNYETGPQTSDTHNLEGRRNSEWWIWRARKLNSAVFAIHGGLTIKKRGKVKSSLNKTDNIDLLILSNLGSKKSINLHCQWNNSIMVDQGVSYLSEYQA